MKLYTILAFALVTALVLMAPFALAEDDNESVISPAPEETEVSDGEMADAITDDLNESVTPLRLGWENVKLWLTFNNEKKAMQELKIARLKLVQARVAARNNDTEAMQNALEAHNRILERIQARIDAIDGASDKEGTEAAAEKLVGLERAIEVHEARILRLNELLASENLTDEQRAKVEDRIAQAENNTAHLREVQAAKKDKLKTRLRAVSNMTEEEADDVISEVEDAHNLSEIKNTVAEIRLRNTERVMEILRGRIAEAEEKGLNVTGLQTAIHAMEKIRDRVQERVKGIEIPAESENETEE